MTLLKRILQQADENGGISVADYMFHALADPDEGYYMQQMPLGAAGDFVTAPEISQVFGEMLGVWVAECWLTQGKPKADVVEMGPGLGTLMDDFLRATKHVEGFHDAIEVHMVETSAKLRKHQRYLLGNKHRCIRWHERLPDSDRALFILGNEFFDALPIEQYVAVQGGFRECMVVRRQKGQEALRFDLSDVLLTRLPHRYPRITRDELDDGDIVEVCPTSHDIMRRLAARIATQGGAALFVDYGYTRPQGNPAAGDTFQAVKQHKHHDVLAAPGSADLTAHVDFTTLAELAVAEGAYTPPVLTQGEFMLRMGGELRAQQLCENARSPQDATDIRNGFRRLIDPAEMGELFKVLAVMPAGIPAPVFTNPPKKEDV